MKHVCQNEEKNFMYKFSISIVKVFLFCLVSGAQSAPSALAQQDNFSIQSEILQETREIVVHLPENYDPDSKNGYPVLYMLDAGMDDESTAQAAHAYYTAKIMPEVIVLAIKNIRRGIDFLPPSFTFERDGEQVSGNGDKFLAFIENELIPVSSEKFRTNGRRVFMGHSWAGQFLAYTLSQSPELFDAWFITSPSIGKYGDKNFSDLKLVFKQDLDFPAFIYVSVGGSEDPRLIRDYDRLTTVLKQHLPAQVKLHVEINEGADHENNAAISITKALQMYFSTTPLSSFSSGSHSQDDFPVLEGPYLGQKPPGSTPEPFAPGIVNTEEWGDAGGFSLDMNEFYVTRWRHTSDAREPESVTFKKVDNRWHKIAVPAGTRKPFHSPDGKTLHFGKRYKERTDAGWSEMKSLGSPFEEIRIMSLTVSNKGTYVFDEMGSHDGNSVLRYSRLIDGKREEPKPLSKEINTGKWNAHPFIAPDESYIMWDGERESGYGDNDIYISFRQKDGSWGEAINLGDKINTDAEEGGPQVTPDGKYLFFNRMVTPAIGDTGPQSDLYWVDAQIIEDLRPKE